MIGRIKAYVGSKTKLATNTLEVEFKLDDKGLKFVAGQYIKVRLPNFVDSNESSMREFSVVSSPANQASLSVAFRMGESKFKQTLSKYEIGTEVELEGPLGSFTLPHNQDTPIVFICGGIGVTPFLSMIRFATSTKSDQKIYLIYANKSENDAPYLNELELLSKQNSKFSYKLLYGVIKLEDINVATNSHSQAMYYVSGLPKMVLDVREMTIKCGIPEHMIRVEEFTGYNNADVELEIVSKISPHMPTEPEDIKITKDIILSALDKFAVVSITDTEGNMTYVNDEFVKVSKYTQKELIGQNHRILKSGLHPQEFYDEMWNKYLVQGKIWVGDICNQAKDGSIYWVHATIVPVFNEFKNITGFIGIRFVITKRKQAEENLLLISDILKQTKQPWFMMNLHGKFVDANQAALNLYGYTLAEFKTLTFSDVTLVSEISNIKKAIKSATDNQQSFEGESIAVKKDNSQVDISYTISTYSKTGTQTLFYGFITDISEIKKRDKELENINLMMIGRENKMIELKSQIAKLISQMDNKGSNDGLF